MGEQSFIQFLESLKEKNLCTFFILPLLPAHAWDYGYEYNVANTFLSRDCKKLYIQVHIYWKVRKEMKVVQSKEEIEYVEVLIPDEWKDDVQHFVKGHYSRMSQAAKYTIEKSGTNVTQYKWDDCSFTYHRLLALEKSPELKGFWELNLFDWVGGSVITEDMELLSVPDESTFLDKELFPVEGFNIPSTEQFERRDMSWVFGKGCVLPERKY